MMRVCIWRQPEHCGRGSHIWSPAQALIPLYDDYEHILSRLNVNLQYICCRVQQMNMLSMKNIAIFWQGYTYFSVQCFVADLGFVDVDFNKRGLFPENTVWCGSHISCWNNIKKTIYIIVTTCKVGAVVMGYFVFGPDFQTKSHNSSSGALWSIRHRITLKRMA